MDLQINSLEILSGYFENKSINVWKRCVATLTGAMEEPMWKLLILAAWKAQPPYGAMSESEGQAPNAGDRTSGCVAVCSASAGDRAGALCRKTARDEVMNARVKNVC